MKVKERLQREKDNLDKIIVYSDGGKFARMYEHSAFAFYTRVEEFKVLVSLNKDLNEKFFHIGFPKETLEKRLKKYTSEVVDEKLTIYTVQLDKPINLEEYENWKIQMEEEDVKHRQKIAEEKEKLKNQNKGADTAQRAQKATAPTTCQDAIDEILAQNVLEMTPLKALSFLAEIQTKLRNPAKPAAKIKETNDNKNDLPPFMEDDK